MTNTKPSTQIQKTTATYDFSKKNLHFQQQTTP